MAKTIKEIASETGVSVTTVRLVIGGHADKYRISPKTQKLVEDHIARHGYVLHHAARSLKLKRSDTIGFVVPDLANPFFARLIAAMEHHCRGRNLVLLTASGGDDPEQEIRSIDILLARGVDGLIVAPCQPPLHRALLTRKPALAVVMVDRDYDQDKFSAVASDNVGSSQVLTGEMLAGVAGPVDFLCADTALPSIRDRITGFSQAMLRAGYADWPSYVHPAAEDGVDSGCRLIAALMAARGGLPKAVMTSSLLVLEGAVQQIKRAIGRVPADLLIGTFDDHAMLDFLPNRVLSVVQDENRLAELAFENLLSQIDGLAPPPKRLTVPCTIVRRN